MEFTYKGERAAVRGRAFGAVRLVEWQMRRAGSPFEAWGAWPRSRFAARSANRLKVAQRRPSGAKRKKLLRLASVAFQVMLKGEGSVTVKSRLRAQTGKSCDARNAFFHELTSLQSRSRDACSRRLLDQRYGHLRRPLHILPRQTQLDRQTSCDVGVAISFKSRGALYFAHPTMAHTRARASLLVSRGVSSRWGARISTLKL